jgi:subtilisin family serine protease
MKRQRQFFKPILLPFLILLFSSCSEQNQQEIAKIETPDLFETVKAMPIEDQYIVVLHENQLSFRIDENDYEGSQLMMRQEVAGIFREYRIDDDNLERVYSLALTGFCARMDQTKLKLIQDDPRVKYVEQDRMGSLGKPVDKPPFKVNEDLGTNTQLIPWGIIRVGGPFEYSGRNSVFVIDTGIQLDHPDLNVNTQKGFDAYNPKKKDWNMDDEHGHGTHVAGTIGALDNNFGVVGVVPGVSVVPVKIFFGPRANYTFSGMIAGIEHVGVRGIPGDVANLSFGGFDSSTALDEAVLRVSEKRRIWMVIASGNSRLPATSFSPARVKGKYTITVSAFDSRDRYAWFSHYGEPIKFGAPGVSVLSTWAGNRYRTETGTSMATPHVAALRLLGDIESDGFVLNYPISPSDPIAFRLRD